MKREIFNIIFGLLLLFLFLGCAKQPQFKETISEEIPTGEIQPTGEVPIDNVGTGISDIGNVEEELDSEELEDLDNILTDIENI